MISYEAGNPHFGGRTVVQLSANGDVLVGSNQGDRTRNFSEKEDPAVHREILRLLKEAHRSISELPGSIPVPGETVVRLRAAIPAETIDLRFWTNQRWRHPVLDQLTRDFERLATKASGGIIRF